jgi:hypothetical protein
MFIYCFLDRHRFYSLVVPLLLLEYCILTNLRRSLNAAFLCLSCLSYFITLSKFDSVMCVCLRARACVRARMRLCAQECVCVCACARVRVFLRHFYLEASLRITRLSLEHCPLIIRNIKLICIRIFIYLFIH